MLLFCNLYHSLILLFITWLQFSTFGLLTILFLNVVWMSSTSRSTSFYFLIGMHSIDWTRTTYTCVLHLGRNALARDCGCIQVFCGRCLVVYTTIPVTITITN